MGAFASLHPLALLLYFASVLVVSMFTLHPVLVGLSLLGGILFYAALNPPRTLARDLAFYCFFYILIAATNPLFSHNGVTPLFFLNGNPVTLEALLYGAVVAAMLVAVIFWCKCYTQVMTSDKFVYLFGRVSPKISLTVSMALRFVPHMKGQLKRIRAAQKTLGLYSTASLFDRLAGEVRVFSALLTWSLENAVETADSMRARGYGLRGRTSFSVFTFRARDGLFLACLAAALAGLLAGIGGGALAFGYYPAVTPLAHGPLQGMLTLLCAAMMFTPFLLELEAGLHWKFLRSRI